MYTTDIAAIERDEAQPWMRRCRELAQQARDHGDAAVGAVIVRNDTIVAEGAEQVQASRDVTAHAELIALRRACKNLGTTDLTGCILYTTVEPCWMCSFAIRESGIGTVVIGAPVADIGGVTSRFSILSDASVEGWRSPPGILWLDPEAH